MSALVDRARALALIAEYLPEARRVEVAEAIAKDIAPDRRIEGRNSSAHAEAAEGARPSPSSTIAEFLAARGYEQGALVRATAKLTHWVAEDAPAAASTGERFQRHIERIYTAHENELRGVA